MAVRSQYALLGQRRFAPFFVTQFLGALNDNIYKQALIALITFHAAGLTEVGSGVAVNLASGLFILPFFVFSATAGQLADKFDKSRVIRIVKLFEIAVMGLGAYGFVHNSFPVLLAALFCMGTHSTFFGPVKYSILPQHLAPEELVGGNAWVEGGTFLAILIGTIAGGLLAAAEHGITRLVPAVTIGVALAGYAASRGVPAAPAAAPDLQIGWNPLKETWRNIGFARRNGVVFKSLLGISWFWFYGALFLAQIPAYAKDYLGGDQLVMVLLLALFSVGIGAGSLLCERLSGRHVEIGLVPFGSIGLSLFALDLYFATPATPFVHFALTDYVTHAAPARALFDFVMIGVFGGFFIVPLYTLIQTRSDREHQSRIIAANNILNALFMVVAALLGAGLLQAGCSVPQLFLLTAVLNAAIAFYIYRQVPEFLLRFLAWLLVHSVYRLERRGLENIPLTGPAVLVCNHVSFVDAVVVMAASPRPVRFVMDHHIFRNPLLGFIFRESKAIPIAPAREDADLLQSAYDEIAQALESGDLIGIFPEGRITDTGELNAFRGGIRRIVERSPVPVIPMALCGLWGSFFSRAGGPAMSNPLRLRPLSKIGLVVDAPWTPQDATPEALQARVLELRGAAL
jgi:1-acyl-sn-glycerol-3-phosphate acyltransferase